MRLGFAKGISALQPTAVGDRILKPERFMEQLIDEAAMGMSVEKTRWVDVTNFVLRSHLSFGVGYKTLNVGDYCLRNTGAEVLPYLQRRLSIPAERCEVEIKPLDDYLKLRELDMLLDEDVTHVVTGVRLLVSHIPHFSSLETASATLQHVITALNAPGGSRRMNELVTYAASLQTERLALAVVADPEE